MSDTPLRIISLQSENVLRLRAVFITPKGNVVQITGANDNGKTSVLNSIWLALKQVMVDAPTPLRKGAQKGRIRMSLGTADGEIELIVTRTIGKGEGLTVETPDGARLPKPQMVLDALIGSLSFDPLAFTRLKPKEQYDELRKAVNVAIDFDKLDQLNRSDSDRRTEVNRQARTKRAEAEGMTLPPLPAGNPGDEKALLDELGRAAEHNTTVERMRSHVQALASNAARMEESAKRNREDAARLRAEADALEQNAAKWEAEAAEKKRSAAETTIPELIDVSAARAKLEQAQAIGHQIAARQSAVDRRDRALREALALEEQSQALTAQMEARDQEKAAAIAGAKLPVPGLGFGDGVVTYGEVPFQQASSAVQLKVSLAIAMAMNPRLRIIRIQDGSLLDEHSMATIEQMATEHDFQVWVERVDTSGKVGIFIEDGMVSAIDGQGQAREQPRLPM